MGKLIGNVMLKVSMMQCFRFILYLVHPLVDPKMFRYGTFRSRRYRRVMKKSRIARRQRHLDLDARLGLRLAALRDEKGLSQDQVARAMRLCRPAVSKIEHGQRALTASEICDYARALNVKPELLFNEIAQLTCEYDSSLLVSSDQLTEGTS